MGRVLLLGAPGVGKGTYGKLLSKSLGLPLVTLGDVIRARGGEQVQRFVRAGELVPDAVVMQLMQQELAKEECRRGFILDGFPRSEQQARALERDLKQKVDLAVLLELKQTDYIVAKLLGRRICSKKGCSKSFNVAHVENEAEGVYMPALLPKNLSTTHCDCGAELTKRQDDTKEVIQNRLNIYERETRPLINFYSAPERSVLERFTILRGLEDMPKLEKVIRTSLK